MPKLLHSVAVQNQDPAADGVQTHDLPVNPLSVVLIALRPLNETSTLGNYQQYLGITDALDRIDIRFRGTSIFSMRGRDAAMMALVRHGIHTIQANTDDTDDERRCAVIPVVLGRRPYDPTSCFPGSRRGELTIELDVDIADTGYDDLQYTIETIELPEASPREYEKQVQIVQTLAATGFNDVDLPLGNLYRGIMLFGTTVFTGAAPAPSWGRLSLLLENLEVGYASTDWEVTNAISGLVNARHPNFDEHTHRVDATSASTTEETDTPIEIGSPLESYAFLQLDPWKDDELAIDTAGRSRFHIRADAETADEVRVVPVERVKL